MSRRKSFTKEQVNEILDAEKAAKNKYEIKRLMILRLRAVQGLAAKEISAIVNYPVPTINSIISKYFQKGIQAMIGENRKGGNHRKLTLTQENELLKGFDVQAQEGKLLIVADIKEAYEKAVGQVVPKSTVYRMLQRHGWRKVMPRSKHPKSKPEEVSAYKKNQE